MKRRSAGHSLNGNNRFADDQIKKNSYLYSRIYLLNDQMMLRFLRFLTPFIVVFLISACVTQTKYDTSRNLAYLYNPSLTSLHPRYHVYHESDQTSILSVKIYPVELLFNQANEAGVYQARLEIFFRLYELSGIRTLADSGHYSYPIDMQNVRREFISNIPLKAGKGKKYNLEIITNDVLRSKAVQAFMPVDKSSDYNFQNFQIYRHNTESKIFNPILDSNQVVQIRYSRDNVDSLYLSYYRTDSIVPYPPSLLIPSRSSVQEPDTSWVLPYNDNFPIKLTEEGIYHYTVDRDIKEGCTLFYFGEHFPSVKTAGQLIDPLEYLLSDAEMVRLKREPNPKLAVDNFWISISENIDKARELIRIYYNRVFYANYFFVSYKEGWKTDRGMIYIIYGSPDILYKNDEEERWIYGLERDEDKIVFTFRKVDNPYTQNDFVLRRSEDLNSRWGEAIASWKRGMVFSYNQ
ncbi:MAG: GWxTD domain-containing protein [Bacteroidales bacterium]|nr:MAG: GWxTD domain-containing protein [Bacteroidales bacterium]